MNAFSQSTWKWPEDKETAQKNEAIYRDYMKSKNFRLALEPHLWLLKNAPDLNKSLYINGVKIYENLASEEMDESKKMELKEKALSMYDLRIKYFNSEKDVLTRKALSAYKYYRDHSSKHKEVIEIFDRVLELNGENAVVNIFIPYMDILARYKSSGGDITNEDFEFRHKQIQSYLDANIQKGNSVDKNKKRKATIDKIFTLAMSSDKNYSSEVITSSKNNLLMADAPVVELEAAGLISYTIKGRGPMAFSEDAGHILALSTDEGRVNMFEISSGDLIKKFEWRDAYGRKLTYNISDMSISTDGKYLLVGQAVHSIVWDIASAKIKTDYSGGFSQGHTKIVKSVSIGKNTTVASSGWDGKLFIWHHYMSGSPSWVNVPSEVIRYSPDGKVLAVGGNYKNLFEILLLSETGSKIKTFRGHSRSIKTLSFSQDGSLLASGSGDKTIRLWDVKSGTLKKTIKCDQYVGHVGISPDGKWIAATSGHMKLLIVDVKSGAVKLVINMSLVEYLAFDKTGGNLAVSSGDQVHILDFKKLLEID